MLDAIKKGAFLENYIVRIYRCEKDNPRSLVGIVEEVEAEGKKAFTNLDELGEIINPSTHKKHLDTDKRR